MAFDMGAEESVNCYDTARSRMKMSTHWNAVAEL